MTDRATMISTLQNALDRQWAIDFLRQAVGQESITGNEVGFVRWLAGRLPDCGLRSVQQEDFLPGRPNIRAVRPGSGGGKSLLFAGHTDTVHVDGWRERWAGEPQEDPLSGALVDGEIWGRGAGDLKGGICAALVALKLLDDLGITLAGDVEVAFVGDEESGEPGTGISAGMKHYTNTVAERTRQPDFAIYVEPTGLAVYPAQMGFFIADITVTGKSAYFGIPEAGIDALKATHAMLTALWTHSDELRSRAEHPLVGEAFLLVTALEGGGYIAVPERCTFSLIHKILPGQCLDGAAKEMERVATEAVADHGVGVEIRYPAGRDHPRGGEPCAMDPTHPAVSDLQQAVWDASGRHAPIKGAPYWSEAPFLINRLGIPTVYCAPGDIQNCHTLHERVSVEEYLSGIVAYAAFMLQFCRAP